MLRLCKISAILFCSLLFSQISFAEIKLEAGSYANRSEIDTLRGEMNLNFTYQGCDPNPSEDKIQFRISRECRDVKNYNLGSSANKTAISGKVGEIITSYKEPSGTCSADKRVTKRLHTNQSFVKLYEEFQKNNCFPSHIVLRDGTPEAHRKISKGLRNRRLCKLPMTHIKKQNFPTDEHSFFNMKANDNGFTIGDHTRYRFDHDRKAWCVKYKEADEKCGTWPSPLPVAYRDDGDKRIHVKATISLGANGNASVRAINKSYGSEAAMFTAQKQGEFTSTNKNKGRIDFNTWRNEKNGLVRSIVRSYRTDGEHAIHERSVNFFARNIFGLATAASWCSKEHCFISPPKNENLNKNRCTEDQAALGTKGCFTNCGKEPNLDMTNGGSGNACVSCIGITPGQCALKKQDVALVRSNFKENENFSIHPTTGEYRLTKNVSAGLAEIYSQIVEKPSHPGCHQGSAPAFEPVFEPGEAPARSVDNAEKPL